MRLRANRLKRRIMGAGAVAWRGSFLNVSRIRFGIRVLLRRIRGQASPLVLLSFIGVDGRARGRVVVLAV